VSTRCDGHRAQLRLHPAAVHLTATRTLPPLRRLSPTLPILTPALRTRRPPIAVNAQSSESARCCLPLAMRERAAATEKSTCWPSPRIAVVGMPLVVDESVAQHVLVKLPMISISHTVHRLISSVVLPSANPRRCSRMAHMRI
jgi:hypothetical protein